MDFYAVAPDRTALINGQEVQLLHINRNKTIHKASKIINPNQLSLQPSAVHRSAAVHPVEWPPNSFGGKAQGIH